jgi:hypothetical protein
LAQPRGGIAIALLACASITTSQAQDKGSMIQSCRSSLQKQ